MANWSVQRFEKRVYTLMQGGQPGMERVGYSTGLSWKSACEAVELAVGRNSLKYGVESVEPVVIFSKNDSVIVMAKECDGNS